MKTIQTLKSEMEEVMSEMKHEKEVDTKESINRYKKLNKRLCHLKICLLYIESDPSIDFVKKEKDRVTNRINLFMDKYVTPEGWGSSMKSKHKRDYEKEMGIPKLRKQLSTLHFILR